MSDVSLVHTREGLPAERVSGPGVTIGGEIGGTVTELPLAAGMVRGRGHSPRQTSG